MTNRNVSSVIVTIRALQEQARTVAGNVELSETGKQRKLSELAQAAAQYKPQALKALGEDWRKVRSLSSQLEERYKQVQASAAERWNYAQLQYEALAAQSSIRQAESLEHVKSLYQEASSSGNRERARAWSEVAPGAVLERFSHGNDSLEANRLILRMRENLEQLVNTPEVTAVESELASLANDERELLSASRETGEYYYGANWDLGEFGGLVENVERAPVDFDEKRARLGLR